MGVMAAAGMVDPANAISLMIARLWTSPEWASRIAEEARPTAWTTESSIHDAGSVVYRFVLEIIRHAGMPTGMSLRTSDIPLDLGKYGTIPAGWPLAWWNGIQGCRMGEDFNPDRWSAEAAKGYVGFGGRSPHCCLVQSSQHELPIRF